MSERPTIKDPVIEEIKYRLVQMGTKPLGSFSQKDVLFLMSSLELLIKRAEVTDE